MISLDQETMMEAQRDHRANESPALNGLGRFFCLHVPDEEREGTCRNEISGALDVVNGSHILQLLEVLDKLSWFNQEEASDSSEQIAWIWKSYDVADTITLFK